MFLGILFSLLFYVHDFHFTFTVLDFSEEEKLIKCSQKVFFNDLEDGLSKYYGQELDLDTIINSKYDTILFGYFKENLVLEDNKTIDAQWVGAEAEGSDLVWIYTEYNVRKLPKELLIKSDLFTNLFNDQANIILLKNMDYNEDRLHFDNADRSKKLERK